jgi:hypothetical protein
LIERAVLDGLCRALGEPLHRLIAANLLGLQLGEIYSELSGCQASDLLPAFPRRSCFVRHTVGLGDALTPGDIKANDIVSDGLPQDLESSIRQYGLRYFKVKLFAQRDRDLERLREVSDIIERETNSQFQVTVDGNENFHDIESFCDFWREAEADPHLQLLFQHIILIEQPVHRDRTLSDSSNTHSWTGRPRMIIDESDGAIGDLPRALALGYAGCSHKNCKGIIKGVANACVLAKRKASGDDVVLTGEDLCNLGPVPLLQDLAMMSLLGVPEHVERNGHHYYRGLSMWPEDWQEKVLANHGDLYVRHPGGFACLDIRQGKIVLDSVNAAPFGVNPFFDLPAFNCSHCLHRRHYPPPLHPRSIRRPHLMSDCYDGIILGTGHNSLILQAYLSRCGLKTLSLDRAETAGGGLMTINNPRLPGFRHNPHSFFHRGVTAMPWYHDLELANYGLRYIEPKLNVAMILPDGRALEWWTDLDRTVSSFSEFSARDADTLQHFCTEFKTIVEKIIRPEAQSPPLEPRLRRQILERSQLGRRFLEISALSPLEFVTRYFVDDVVRAGLLFFNGLREVDLRLNGFGHSIPALLASSPKAQMAAGGSASLARALVATWKCMEEQFGAVITLHRLSMRAGRVAGVGAVHRRTYRGEQLCGVRTQSTANIP